MNLALDDEYLKILIPILKEAKVKFYAFGSRVQGTQEKFSDLDLVYKEPIEKDVLRKIKSSLRESDLPITVDIIDYQSCSEEFKRVLDLQLLELTL